MASIAIVFSVVAFAFTWLGLTRYVRKKAMLSLAVRLGFEYSDRILPASFPSTQEPFDKLSLTWNVMRGQRKAIEVVVFDSIFGQGRGIFRTCIAVRTAIDPFPKDEQMLGNVMQSS
jgi:hypothetical protein